MKLHVQGTVYDKRVGEIWFQIMRCDENSQTREPDDPKCHSKEDIDRYVKDLEVEIIVVNKQMNFDQIDGTEPTFTTQSTLGSSLLHDELASTNNLYLEYNWVETEDDLVQVG